MMPPEEKPVVLVVEDDTFSRQFAELLLARVGYQPVSAESVEAARVAVLNHETGYFSCLLTDHLLPGASGMDLLTWIKQHDPTLASILMTSDDRKSLVEDALQAGAVDFINKPFHIDQLRSAVAKAIEATAQRRQVAQMERDVEQVAEVQRRMVLGDRAPSGFLQVCFHPKHQAGGDSFSQYQISEGRSVVLMTDVSGHDLKAAFVSAYFQGMVRAMLESGSSLAGVFDRCNRFLLQEWGDAASVAASISACSVVLDRDSETIEVLTCGSPDPILSDPEGRLRNLGSRGSAPLGWFSDLSGGSVSVPMKPGEIFLWTDGVDDLARQLEVTPLSVVHRLFGALERGADPPWLARASDDVMAARIPVCKPGEMLSDCTRPCASPVIMEEYSSSHRGEIDSLQSSWERSLKFAFPELRADVVYDFLLCSREAVLNALQHGCASERDRISFQVCLLASGSRLRVRIDDPGPGHEFDVAAHSLVAADTLMDRHRGLMLMRNLPAHFSSERGGASIVMDFHVEE